MHRQSRSPSRQQSHPRDEASLPTGQCQYLLLQPELRGQRCACLRFSLLRSTPGSACSCGHLAVYHLASKEEATSAEEDIEVLKQKVQRLEQILEEERSGRRNSLSLRLSELEEHVDKCKVDIESEVKMAYRGIEGLWHNIGILQKRASLIDDRIDAMVDANQATQDDVRTMQERLMQVDDATMVLEDRLDSLASPSRQAISSAAGSPSFKLKPKVLPLSELDMKKMAIGSESISDDARQSVIIKNTGPEVTASETCEPWTVHISLLPSASQPFPFEKDTMAYKRCLSRGLHRVVVIPGTDSQSFITATSNEFFGLLRGRPWMPLVSKLCDAESLRGLPMLRQLPDSLTDPKLYDTKFLKENCATVDANNNIPDLYIALCSDTFSWPELKALPQFLSGLEACWAYDSILDSSRVEECCQSSKKVEDGASVIDNKLSTAEFLPAWPSPRRTLKRTASNISRATSINSMEGDGKRPKLLSQRSGTSVEVEGRRAETV